ncbi:MAG: hypothetical protein LBK47_01110 [Prevotellaceae bacterium]|nr:hypothetical protein [Prevotellaceae bacterium]
MTTNAHGRRFSIPLRRACPALSEVEGSGMTRAMQTDSSTPLRGACPERSRGGRNDEPPPNPFLLNNNGAVIPTKRTRNEEARGGTSAGKRNGSPCRTLQQAQGDNARCTLTVDFSL